MPQLWNDLRYALRTLRKSPTFSIVAVLTLALGLGAVTAIFTVVNAVILRPLPFPESEEILALWELREKRPYPVAPGNFAEWNDRSTSFEALAIVDLANFNITGSGQPERLPGAKVSADFFRVLRIDPVEGRVFAVDEDQPGAEKVAVLSYGLWQRRFGGKEGVLGQRLNLDEIPYTVIGIMGPDFDFPYLGEEQDIWIPRPITEQDRTPTGRGARSVAVLGRLADGVSLDQARAEMSSITQAMQEEFPVTNGGWGAHVVGLYQQAVKDSGRTLFFLLAAVGLLLLVALANVANLVLARSTTRRREVALRVALGAGRGRLIRQLLTEHAVLALVAGVLGLFLASATLRFLLGIDTGVLPRLTEVRIDLGVFLFTLALSLVVGLILGLAPVLRMRRLDSYDALKEGDAKSAGSRRQAWSRGLLLCVETALVLVLLIGGGLMIRGFVRLVDVDPGFDTEDRVAVEVFLPRSKYPEKHRIQEFFQRLDERAQALPGTRSTAITTSLPLDPGGALSKGFVIEGRPIDLSNIPSAGFDIVTPAYFRTLGIPLLAGRLPDSRDQDGSAPVLVINEAMAKNFWPDENAVGRRVQFEEDGPWLEVIGMVRDVRTQGLDSEPRPTMYQPLSQMSITWSVMQVVAHAESGPQDALINALREAVWSLDPDQSMEIRTLEEVTEESLSRRRFSMFLLVVFGSVGLALGGLGIYGVVSYTVSQQRRQIGIRAAFGADRGDIFRWVTIRGMVPVLVGIAIGVVAALLLGRWLAGYLYDVSPADPLTFITLSGLLALVALAATYFPARRATRVDPMLILREE